MRPKVGIVTINRNGIQDTRMCLDSLLKIDYANYEIYVVDNASDNGEGMILEKEYKDQITMIYNAKNEGFAGGCNVGINQALTDGCEYRLLFNNDAVATKNFLDILVNAAEDDPRSGIVGSTVLYPDGETIWSNGGSINLHLGVFSMNDKGKRKNILSDQKNREVDYICGACFLCKKEVSDVIGLLDEDYFAYYEEADYCWRAKKHGWKSLQVPTSIILHDVGSSTNTGQRGMSATKAYLIARNGLLFGSKNVTGLQYIWYVFTQFVIIFPYSVLNNIASKKVLISYIQGLFHSFTGYNKL